MSEKIDLSDLVQRLVESAYPELISSNIKIQWGRTSSFATISWTEDFKNITVRCSSATRQWHEAALTGLLAHELSHPAQCKKHQSERGTDLDAVKRGFGPYLGVERLIAGKYEDHIIRRGKDRYLGYRSIRKLLNSNELIHLDALLTQLRLVPSRKVERQTVHHDTLIIHSSTCTTIQIDGHEFEIPFADIDPEVRTVVRNNITYVIVNEEEVGHFSPND
ncbi:MAG: hypothetical protein ACTSU3_02185 [Candidatus Thorarchaeota archaeon]